MKYQVMPDLTPIEYEALKADIAERGVLVPVEVDEGGAILDGHHRVKAWNELRSEGVGVPDYPRMIRTGLTEEQKRNHARSLNVLRRHLSRDQRDEVMRAMRADGATYQEIADALGVNVATAHRAAADTELLQMQKVKGADGKYYPSSYERRTLSADVPSFLSRTLSDGTLVHGPIGDYWQKGDTKECATCKQLWAADLNYCPYCNISPDARVAYMQSVQSKPGIFVPGGAVTLERTAAEQVAKQVQQERSAERRQEREMMYQQKRESPPLVGKYRVIYADPPWQYDNSGFDQSAAEHYPTMSTQEICNLPVFDLADEPCALYLWATVPLLPDAIEVMNAWGFEYKSHRVWVKNKAPGMGWWLRTNHELLMIGTKNGNAHPAERLESVVEAPVTKHSRKPEVFRLDIEKCHDGPRLEMFARERFNGWEVWGNEL